MIYYARRARLRRTAAGPAGPTTLVTGVSGDTFLDESDPETNNGAGERLVVGGNPAGLRKRALLVPDLSALPPGATVITATLALYVVAENDTSDVNLTLHRSLVETFPGESGSPFSCWSLRSDDEPSEWDGGAGGVAGTEWTALATDTAAVTATGATITFDVAADVTAWLGGADAFGWWLLNSAEATPDSQKELASLNNSTAGQRPVLTITYTS